MTFWMGVIIGSGVGMVLCTVFYMWLFKVALKIKPGNDEFLEVQKKNGMELAKQAQSLDEIAEAIGEHVTSFKYRDS